MKEYPQGAIQTVEQLRALGKNAIVFCTSRQHYGGKVNQIELSGTTGVKTYANGTECSYFEVIERYSDKSISFVHNRSFADVNIPLNGCNDWFLFEKKKEAEAYLNVRPQHETLETQDGKR